MSEEDGQNNLSDSDLLTLSCHYDALIWTIVGLWVPAIGGFLAYGFAAKDPKPLLIVLGSFLNPLAMFFIFSFRLLRHRVNKKMSDSLQELLKPNYWPNQWCILTLLFAVLTTFGGVIAYCHSPSYWSVAVIVFMVILILILSYRGRSPKSQRTIETAKDAGVKKG